MNAGVLPSILIFTSFRPCARILKAASERCGEPSRDIDTMFWHFSSKVYKSKIKMKPNESRSSKLTVATF